MRRRVRSSLLLLLAVVGLLAGPSAAQAKRSTTGLLRAGAGQADLTPPRTGYFLGGWTRSDRVGKGVSTRLFANAIVLQRGTRKVALVAAELFAVPAGFQEDVARQVADLGYTRESVLVGASHTHSAPGGWTPNPTYNTAAPPSAPFALVQDPDSVRRFLQPAPADRQLYTFLVRQTALAIRRADDDRALAAAGWGRSKLTGLTQNRSLEAHLADHGVLRERGAGSVGDDPEGEEHTIDPTVDVLRVDKLVLPKARKGRKRSTRRIRVPIGAWSSFANHGTVVKSETELFSGDHHAAAWRLFADRVRKASPTVPRTQTIVNVYPNGAEGDQSAGLRFSGIDGAIEVGGREAGAMVQAWRAAASDLRQRPVLDLRWTRACLCGRQTSTGPVDPDGVVGAPFLTGSEEGRGPLFDLTGVPLEGLRTLEHGDPQAPKVETPVGGFPEALPFAVLRVGRGAMATLPGEGTKEVGARVRSAVLGQLGPAGVDRVAISGLTGEFVQYITTPEEYSRQHYEGASTVYGRNEGTFVVERLGELAGALRSGAAAPAPHEEDVSYGVKPDGPPYPLGASSGAITTQPPAEVVRGTEVAFGWRGGPRGEDRPVDSPFVRAERLVGKRWRVVDSDLALDMLWRVDDAGQYSLVWKPATTIPNVPPGTYRLRVSANRYGLISRTFRVR